MVVSPWNGIKSFLIAPDGSHEGPEESDVFDVLRGRFVEWVNAQVAVQGYPPVAWAEVVLEDEERIGGNEDGLVTYLSRSSRDGYPEEDE
jgi:hypothetical protein